MSSGAGTATSHGHVCFAYDDRAVLEAHARDFLAAGEAAGERVWYLAATPPRVAMPFMPLAGTYRDGEIVHPGRQVAAYTAATEEALATGFTGLRVVADATPLVRSPAQLDAFTRYEVLIDRFMRDHPFSALCAYDRGELGDAVVARVACMHAESNTEVPFRLHACPPADGCAAITGELDLGAHDLLTAALEHVDLPAGAGAELVLEAAGLTFADHRSLVRLDEFAGRRGVTVVLRDAAPALGRLAALLDLDRLRVEVAG